MIQISIISFLLLPFIVWGQSSIPAGPPPPDVSSIPRIPNGLTVIPGSRAPFAPVGYSGAGQFVPTSPSPLPPSSPFVTGDCVQVAVYEVSTKSGLKWISYGAPDKISGNTYTFKGFQNICRSTGAPIINSSGGIGAAAGSAVGKAPFFIRCASFLGRCNVYGTLITLPYSLGKKHYDEWENMERRMKFEKEFEKRRRMWMSAGEDPATGGTAWIPIKRNGARKRP